MKWQSFLYENIYLNMGGEKNPEGPPICIVEKPIGKSEETFKLNTDSRKLIGSWLIEGENWGFTLYDDGTASSINSATLIYHRWSIKNAKICLTTRSIGNHTQSVSTECHNYKVTGSAGKEILKITQGGYQEIYQRN